MKSPPAPAPPDPPKDSIDNEATGLPGFKTWRGVYLFVLGTFVAWVVLLALLTGLFP
jgi:hypothetical protein